MKEQQHKIFYRKDYQLPEYWVESLELDFILEPKKTIVTATAIYKKNINNIENNILTLNGEHMELIEILMNGLPLDESQYKVESTCLQIFDPPDFFTLRIKTVINPEENKALTGLYRSNNIYCTQCEAEGFRRITYFPDRPDILTRYTTRITADRSNYPVILSNGNLIDSGSAGNGKHFAVWSDPFPKPSYLFALVGGDLFCLRDSFTTMSGRQISLEIYVEPRNKEKCDHAMLSLKKAMKWDEEVYGLEYDLDTYMIVAVDDFNMGAMENKGLNIFNSKYVLASPESATDQDYLGVEGVIAHEYFHNWTGNRVTCRDWFQLSLKEGLTVFRDQEFSADMNSRAVERIGDVKILRNHQFREDASPMAHPVRPDSYVEINNFYTVTVYNKGAEVIRMLYAIIGKENFHKGMDLYFDRYDGMAVTCDDFVNSMVDASGVNLDQFKLWYSQSGTPVLHVEEFWDKDEEKFILTIEQKTPPTPGQKEKHPFHIPINTGLITLERGADSTTEVREKKQILQLTEKKKAFTFTGYAKKPVVSILRSFSAPVKVEKKLNKEELAILMAHDSDLFNRWESAFQFSVLEVFAIIEQLKNKERPRVSPLYIDSFRKCLTSGADEALIAHALTLPSENYIAQQMAVVEPSYIREAMKVMETTIADSCRNDFVNLYQRYNTEEEYSVDPASMGERSLKNRCLAYLLTGGSATEENIKMCMKQYRQKHNMTDVFAALSALSHLRREESIEVLEDFYNDWRHEPLVVDKWLAIQATSKRTDTLSEVKRLTRHESFSIDNPNKVRALIGTFSSLNHSRFHDESGAGYRFLTEKILQIDKNNPQLAARLVSPLITFAVYSLKLRALMEEQLRFILLQKDISPNVYEIVKKTVG